VRLTTRPELLLGRKSVHAAASSRGAAARASRENGGDLGERRVEPKSSARRKPTCVAGANSRRGRAEMAHYELGLGPDREGAQGAAARELGRAPELEKSHGEQRTGQIAWLGGRAPGGDLSRARPWRNPSRAPWEEPRWSWSKGELEARSHGRSKGRAAEEIKHRRLVKNYRRERWDRRLRGGWRIKSQADERWGERISTAPSKGYAFKFFFQRTAVYRIRKKGVRLPANITVAVGCFQETRVRVKKILYGERVAWRE
jgi:hypothetical protein